MSFRLIFEVGAPKEPELRKVRRQIEIFGPVTDAILCPDNHLGRAAVSSVALGIEVLEQGFKPVVSLNARDRNRLRFRSDIITLKALDVGEVLFVYGDDTAEGRSDLKVAQMLADPSAAGLLRGVAASIGRPLKWRTRADFLFTQLAFGRGKPGYWREAQGFSQPLYCGVIALQNRDLARKFLSNIPGLTGPQGYLEEFEKDGEAGFKRAIAELDDLYEAGVDGAHLVVPAGWLRFADMLGEWRSGKADLPVEVASARKGSA